MTTIDDWEAEVGEIAKPLVFNPDAAAKDMAPEEYIEKAEAAEEGIQNLFNSIVSSICFVAQEM